MTENQQNACNNMGAVCCKRSVQENEALISKKIAPDIESTTSKFQSPHGYTGLDNMGNTCFINACLQCLSHCNPLVEYLLKLNASEREHKFLRFFQDIVKIQWEKIYDSIVPKRIFDLVQDHFEVGTQYDAHEFLTYFLNKLHQEDLFLDQIFRGELKVSIVCTQCNFTVVKSESFLTLSLAMPNSRTSLKDCLRKFVCPESIDQWQCSSCGGFTTAQKFTEFSKIPQVLIVHLKRFQVINGQIRKNSKKVSCEIARLKIEDGNRQEQSYNLFGVIDHYGDLANGHYTASVLHRLSFKWQLCNDHAIYAIDIDNVVSENAYMLFYINTSSIGNKPKIWRNKRSFQQLSTSHREVNFQEDTETNTSKLPPLSNTFQQLSVNN